MAQPAPPRAPQLPDFAIIAQHHRDLASELSKCANIPAFDNGRAILDAILNLTEEVRGMKKELRARDVNNMSRLVNSQLISPSDELHPLCCITTGLPIPNFPQTPASLSDLDSPSVNAILRELGAETTGRPQARMQRLRAHIGLRPVPV